MPPLRFQESIPWNWRKFLPTESSFRLGDLAESIGFVRENPHQADSDAEVTAALLLYIESIMRELPWVTLKQIAQLSGQMGMQTSQYIQRIVSERTEEPLPEHLEEIDGLVLRKRVCHCLNQAIFKESILKLKRIRSNVLMVASVIENNKRG